MIKLVARPHNPKEILSMSSIRHLIVFYVLILMCVCELVSYKAQAQTSSQTSLSRVVKVKSKVGACTGTIVNPEGTIVLTDAHCVLEKDYRISVDKVRVGDVKAYKVLTAAKHSDPNQFYYQNLRISLSPSKDTALIFLEKSLAYFSDWIMIYPAQKEQKFAFYGYGESLKKSQSPTLRRLMYWTKVLHTGEILVRDAVGRTPTSVFFSGDSGGAMFDELGNIVAMATAAGWPSGIALPGEIILENIKNIAPEVAVKLQPSIVKK